MKLDALFSFVVFFGMLLDHYYGECLCVGKLSPVITFVFYYYNRAEAKDHLFLSPAICTPSVLHSYGNVHSGRSRGEIHMVQRNPPLGWT